MRDWKVFHHSCALSWLSIVVVLCFSGFPAQVAAQNSAAQGDKAVWSCPGPCVISGSTAVVDASAFCTQAAGSACVGPGGSGGVDFCRVLRYALNHLPSNVSSTTVTVDARGIIPGNHGSQQCSVNPFSGVTYAGSVVVLLPASAIQLTVPWILPSNTRLVGEGLLTSLVVTSGFQPDGTNSMVEMGTTSGSTGVVIEHLKLDGGTPVNGVGMSGIYNANAQDYSYVNDVALFSIGAGSDTQLSTTTGLWIGPGATNSGPYSNLYVLAAQNCTRTPSCNPQTNLCACVRTACVKIQATTRGLHGITCSASSTMGNTPPAAVYLDASNNTIEDVHVEGYQDAVVVGDNADGENVVVAGNTLANIVGAAGSGPVGNAVHVCSTSVNYSGTGSACVSQHSNTVTDLTVLDANSTGIPSTLNATTIQDDLTGATVNSSAYAAFVGKYVLGEPVMAGSNPIGYSRFATSLGGTNGTSMTVPTWLVGAGVPPSNNICTMPGALYSNTTGSAGQTIWVCSGGKWVSIL